jgi:rare lipoprotein A
MTNASFIRVVVAGLVILSAAPAGQGDAEALARAKAARRYVGPAVAPTAPAPPTSKPYQVGLASWYGERFQGRPTANGEPYDMFQLTAAHLHLPLGSLVRVTYPPTRRSVVVRINDRGPVRPNLMIDLSYAAARELGLLRRGIARVRLDLVRQSEGPQPLQATALRLPPGR